MLCVACLKVFVNCLVKQFIIWFGVVAILLLNVMEVFSVGGGALLDRPLIPPIHNRLQLHASQYNQKTQHPSYP